MQRIAWADKIQDCKPALAGLASLLSEKDCHMGGTDGTDPLCRGFILICPTSSVQDLITSIAWGKL